MTSQTNAPHQNSQTALLAEDDELIRDIVSTYLEKLGYDVIEAKDGQNAIDIIESLNYDRLSLLVTDLLMPKKTGEQVVATARAQKRCDRFLIISGFSESMPRECSKSDGEAVYLEKPFTFRAFQDKIAELEQRAATAD